METTIRTKKTLAEQTADRLAETIMNAEFKTGQQLPSEFQLAEKLDVGRGTIREAIKILISRHVVEIKRGTGTFVAERPGQVEDPLGLAYIKDKKKLSMDLYEMRLMIEPQIASLAAKRVTKEGMMKIEESLLAIEANIAKKLPWTDEDIAFHETIAQASGNQLASTLIPIIHSAVKIFAYLYGKPLTETTIATHREILDAIRDKNPERAEIAMRKHLQRNRVYAEHLRETAGDNA